MTVQDSGEGLAPELLPHIFDLFSQGERTPDRSQGGLGLGLALVALTGYGQPQDKEDARQAGFDQHVAKPAEPARILALLERSVSVARDPPNSPLTA